MKFKLLKPADTQLNEQTQLNQLMIETLTTVATNNNTTFDALAESVTHVLANIAAMAGAGENITLMSADSVAGFMAGVDRIASLLPTTQDGTKKANTLKVLTTAGIGPDGMANTAVAPIAQVGANSPQTRQKYTDLLKQYIVSVQKGQPDGAMLAREAKRLQSQIDQAMRAAQANAQPAQAAPTSMRQKLGQK